MKVAVLLGGMSREREVSLKTGKAVIDAVRALGHQPIPIDPGRGVARDLVDSDADIVFIALHGRWGEDGTIQGLLEILGMPYTGSGVLASAAAMDKIFTKRIFRSTGLPTPDFMVRTMNKKPDQIEHSSFSTHHSSFPPPPFPPPYVVKPAREGSSLGMSFVDDPRDLPGAVQTAFLHDASVLVEAQVHGVEITVGVIGNDHPEALPAIEIAPKSGRYDYASKYTVGATEYIIPPRLPEVVIADCRALALQAHRALGCSGLSRIDMIVGESGIELLEVNTIPGMTETSLLPKAAAAAGIPFPELIGRIIRWGMEARG
jgi:D-alanine-D-alanine ligase